MSASPVPNPGAGGGGVSAIWSRPAYQNGAATGVGGTAPCPTSPTRATPRPARVVAYYNGAWTGFGGTSVGAPTNAGFFADTNQGCFAQLGMADPALYAAGWRRELHRHHDGEQRLHRHQRRAIPARLGYDEASGLGTPVDQNLAIALQGGDGCPSVAGIGPDTGPVDGGGPITIFGGGFADATSVTFGAAGTGRILAQSETSITVVPPNAPGPRCVDVTVATHRASRPCRRPTSTASVATSTAAGATASWPPTAGVFDFGDAGFFGSARAASTLNAPVVGMADTPSTNGYWLVASDGGIFSFGDAPFFGSMGGQHLNKPIVGMAATPDGGGYWLVASDGGIFSFGDAPFFGSTGGIHLNKPIVGMAATPDGGGYWLVASDGGIFSYGDARSSAPPGACTSTRPSSAWRPRPDGGGYWLVAADGGIFAYGDARLLRLGRRHPPEPAGRRHGRDTRRRRLLARGGRRRHLHLRRRGVLRLDGQPPPQQAHRRDVVDLSCRGQGLVGPGGPRSRFCPR